MSLTIHAACALDHRRTKAVALDNEPNLYSSKASALIRLLDLPRDDFGFDLVPVDVFIARCHKALRQFLKHPDQGTASVFTEQWTETGLLPGVLQGTVAQVLAFSREAQRAGATHLYGS